MNISSKRRFIWRYFLMLGWSAWKDDSSATIKCLILFSVLKFKITYQWWLKQMTSKQNIRPTTNSVCFMRYLCQMASFPCRTLQASTCIFYVSIYFYCWAVSTHCNTPRGIYFPPLRGRNFLTQTLVDPFTWRAVSQEAVQRILRWWLMIYCARRQ